jgi:hypothetical protein
MPNINLSDEQYKQLIDLVFLGNWMINSFKTEDMEMKYEELEQYLLSKASEFKQEDYVIFDEKLKQYFTTRKHEEENDKYIQEYDNYTFWDELGDRLATRDMKRIIGPVKSISDEHWSIKHEIEETYSQEFEKNGIKNVNVEMNNNKQTG